MIEARLQQALARMRAGQPGEAEALCRAVLRDAPGQFGAHNLLGKLLLDSGRAAAAEPHLAEAMRLQPGNPLARFQWHMARGLVRTADHVPADAIAEFRAALAIDPDSAWAHNNLADALVDIGDPASALRHLERALALAPGYAQAHANRGLALEALLRFDEARAAYDAALAARPDYPEALKRRATLALLRGDFAGGWADYAESLRRYRAQDPQWRVDLPAWNGEPLEGRSILLHEPSGIGDTLQFFRYVPLVAARAGHVAFAGPPRLFHLLRQAAPGVEFLADPADRDFDVQCDLWSLPHLFGTKIDTVPAPTRLAVDEARVAHWRAWLGEGGPGIGIAWQGNPARKVDHGRSVPLAAFAALAAVPGVRLVSLQRGPGLEQLQSLPAGMLVRDPGTGFDAGDDAFGDTAALMMSLDVVVSSDSAVAHLAGSLDRPTWLALKRVPEWRWGLERDDSPWYPSMRLFRQPAPGDWRGVFAAMAAIAASMPGRPPSN